MLIIAPVISEAGNMFLCDEVPSAALAMCGATIPAKPSGPQNAVTAAVMMQQLKSADSLILTVSAPAISANSSPKSMISSPFRFLNAMKEPSSSEQSMMKICGHVEVEKLPADQL